MFLASTIFIFFQVSLTDPMIIHENALFLGMSLILCKLPTCPILYHYPSLEGGLGVCRLGCVSISQNAVEWLVHFLLKEVLWAKLKKSFETFLSGCEPEILCYQDASRQLVFRKTFTCCICSIYFVKLWSGWVLAQLGTILWVNNWWDYCVSCHDEFKIMDSAKS